MIHPIALLLLLLASVQLCCGGSFDHSPSKTVQRMMMLRNSVGRDVSSVQQKTILGQSPIASSSAVLANFDTSKAAALKRIAAKHGVVSEKRLAVASPEGPSDDDASGAMPPKPLDAQIHKSSHWLAQAVMVLAILAGSTILGGIIGVIYCWNNRGKLPTKEERLNGKNYGRATPQYGSYGVKGRR
ncbi:hypothetical protein GUITHDRAFT_115518 [Guillardia theta CCMP2712]|uniref:Uncharacterized protein n=1 Tax=Guillardia theta (strain CCMP2712) TaxID=905079 RepID=L1IQN4_GUITC|nr:hypothetical protein GUITHDRAFT_115518 [Guillardia theta CCMP2712]EKX38377.1 hypothetical protein GUITHDRAFT_115518 [Guillardia theta CCMP2712]|eukprot:XP_005825357.1 hypothetical protein GUITHDRAFT_115518 [Guillardia theta CCMP2712]